MKKYLLIILFLVLGLIASPVCAYIGVTNQQYGMFLTGTQSGESYPYEGWVAITNTAEVTGNPTDPSCANPFGNYYWRFAINETGYTQETKFVGCYGELTCTYLTNVSGYMLFEIPDSYEGVCYDGFNQGIYSSVSGAANGAYGEPNIVYRKYVVNNATEISPSPTPTPTPTPYPTTPVPTIAPGYSRTSFQCTNSMNTAAIAGCDIQLHNLEGNVWSNRTDTDGTWYIDTLPYAHINAYSQATGYTDGTRLNANVWVTPTFYTILMVPGYVPPANTGYVWVYVHVLDADGGGNLADARVDIQGSGLTTRSDYTDSSGVVRFQWPNVSTAYINAAKAGYTTSSRVITTSPLGPEIVDIELHRGTQTATMIPTTGPGGTVPTTIGPWGTPGPQGTMPSGYTNSQGQMMMDLLARYGLQIVELCILVTILALVGVRLGK